MCRDYKRELWNYYRNVALEMGKGEDEDGNEIQTAFTVANFYGYVIDKSVNRKWKINTNVPDQGNVYFDRLNDLARSFLGTPQERASLFQNQEHVTLEDISEFFLEEQASTPNESQKQAILCAVNNPISMIQGPPGTGKTEMILHLASVAMRQGKTMAIVSGNNMAVQNIGDKLDEYYAAAIENDWDMPNLKALWHKYAKLGNMTIRRKFCENRHPAYDPAKEEAAYNIAETLKKSKNNGVSSREFLSIYPFISSTLHSLRRQFTDSERYSFDYVVVDECSQVNTVLGLLAMMSAKHLVLVGDREQLPPVIIEDSIPAYDRAYFMSGLGEEMGEYRIAPEVSFLTQCIDLYPDAPNTLLNQHYRCHPGIIEFCNENVYDNRMQIMTSSRYNPEETPIRVRWFDGNYSKRCSFPQKNGEMRFSKENIRQLTIFMEEEWPLLAERLEADLDRAEEKGLGEGAVSSACILTPFVGQRMALERVLLEDERFQKIQRRIAALSEQEDDHAEADDADKLAILTVHKAQGRGYDYVYLLPVDDMDWEFPWSQKKCLVNVAVSRAKKELIVVVSAAMMTNEMRESLELPPLAHEVNPAYRDLTESQIANKKFLQKLLTYVYERCERFGVTPGFGFVHTGLTSIFDQSLVEHDDEMRVFGPERCFGEFVLRRLTQDSAIKTTYGQVGIQFLRNADGSSIAEGEEDELVAFAANENSHFDFVLCDSAHRVRLIVEIDGADNHVYLRESGDAQHELTPDEKKNLFVEQHMGNPTLYLCEGGSLSRLDEGEPSDGIIFLRLPCDGRTYHEDVLIDQIFTTLDHQNLSEAPITCHAKSMTEIVGTGAKVAKLQYALSDCPESKVRARAAGTEKIAPPILHFKDEGRGFYIPNEAGARRGVAAKYGLSPSEGRFYLMPVYFQELEDALKGYAENM